MAARKPQVRTDKHQQRHRAAIDAARNALPSPRPGTPAHAIWTDVLGLRDRDPEPLPRTAEEVANYVDPHERLRLALKSSLDGTARASHRKPTKTKAINDALVAKLQGMGVDLSIGREFDKVRRGRLEDAMAQTGINPLPKVDSFVRWLRRRAAD